jgi:hypothetical protein
VPTVTAEDGLRHCQELLQTRRQFRLVRAMLAKMPHLSGVELPVQGGSCMSDGKRLLQQLQPGVRFELLDRRDSEKKMTPAGLEPAIPGSVGRCLIHWATGPGTMQTRAQKPTILGQPWGFGPPISLFCGGVLKGTKEHQTERVNE